MKHILNISIKEIWKNKLLSFLILIVCSVALYTIFSAITSCMSIIHQRLLFEDNIGLELENVLQIDYLSIEEDDKLTDELKEYLFYISSLDNIHAVGKFQLTGQFFDELSENSGYIALNNDILQGTGYENVPNIVRTLIVDEGILSLVDGGLSKYQDLQNGQLPAYASEYFKDVLPIGTVITHSRTKQEYQISGYFPKGTKWVNGSNLIRFPIISLDGFIITPFSEVDENDIMTQLSCLHNTYILLDDNADINDIKNNINEYAEQHGFSATANTLAEEYSLYESETNGFVKKQTGVAIFIFIMCATSIISVFMTNAFLKRNQYGVMLANGYTQKDIGISIFIEILTLMLFSGIVSWLITLIGYLNGHKIFRSMLLLAHIRFTPFVCLAVILLLSLISAILPILKIIKYQPNELIGDENHD